jgi:hypothetical protein
MATRLHFFMTTQDERAFLRHCEGLALEVYPIRVPPGWQPFLATEANQAQLPEEECYLAASAIGPALVDPIKRGPDKGLWRIDEVRSPVIFYRRSRLDEDGALRAGSLWAEIEVTPETGRKNPAPERFRRMVVELEDWLKKQFRKSDPKGFYVGNHAAREHKSGLQLLTNDHKGKPIRVHK